MARESLNFVDNNVKLSIENIMKKGKLIEKIRNEEENFSFEEINLIKASIENNTTMRPYSVFQCLQILESEIV